MGELVAGWELEFDAHCDRLASLFGRKVIRNRSWSYLQALIEPRDIGFWFAGAYPIQQAQSRRLRHGRPVGHGKSNRCGYADDLLATGLYRTTADLLA